MIRVPLIIKPPHSRDKQKVAEGQVRNIDIMPTIVDYCGLKAPQECDGQSLRPCIEGGATPHLPSITETHGTRDFHLLAFRQGGHKVIYDFIQDRVWLYDLVTDPSETKNLLPDSAAIEPAPEERSSPGRQKEQLMRTDLLHLLSLRQMSDLALTAEDLGEIDEKTKAQLKALGYVY
jgi:arylsulfatase A-like enzyme